MGSCPDWYDYVRASRYYRSVPPWELVNRPRAWTTWALIAEAAEAYAQEQHMNREQRRAKSKRR